MGKFGNSDKSILTKNNEIQKIRNFKKNKVKIGTIMLEFRKITRENFSELLPFFANELESQKRNKVRIADYTPGSVMMWHDTYDDRFAIVGDAVIFNTKFENGQRCYYYPVGKNKKHAIKALAAHIKECGGCAVIADVGEGRISKISKEMYIVEAYSSRDMADYLYNKSEFENPAGRKHHKRKNLINRFASENPWAHFEPLSKDNIDDALKYYKDYSRRNPESSSIENDEYKENVKLLSDFDFDIFSGGLLYSGDKIIGLTIGEVYGDTVYVHTEKAEKEIAGSYQTLSKDYLLSITDSTVKYVNREEDLGLPGLRRSKMAYGPAWLEYKYVLRVTVE